MSEDWVGGSMKSDALHIVTAVANPVRWKSRILLARAAIANWLREPNVHVTIVEVAHGARGYELADLGEPTRVTHVPVRATTLAWSKENCLNVAISRLPTLAELARDYVQLRGAQVQIAISNENLNTANDIDELRQAASDTAKERTNSEHNNAEQKIALAPDYRAQPAGNRQHDAVRDEIGSERPGRFIVASR
jgi:hypothetical protein